MACPCNADMAHLLVKHLDPLSLAAYLDGMAAMTDRAAVESHLATCRECRTEWLALADALRVLRAPARGWIAPLAVAAALLLFVLVPKLEGPATHREPEMLTVVAPVVMAPAGPVASARTIEWSRVPGVDRYRVTVFDSAGVVIWQAFATDTAATLPPAVVLVPGTPYYLRVHARSGFDRWTGSKLVEFRLAP